MKESRFNVDVLDESGDHLIFNTLSRALIVLGSDEYEKLKRNDLDSLREDLRSGLLKYGIVIDDDVDESSKVEYYFNRLRYSNILSLTIVLGYSCNLRCAYCYERRKSRKSGESAALNPQKLLAWLRSVLRWERPQHVHVAFYGGEPLLYFDNLVCLAEGISQLCTQYHASYDFELMTNAVLLNKSKSRALQKLDVACLQLTLDGPPDVHDRYRISGNGQPTFHTIISNVEESIAYFERILIRVNVDQDNISAVHRLLDILSARTWMDRIVVYFTPIIAQSERRNRCPYSSTGTEFAKALGGLIQEAARRGIRTNDAPYTIAPCHLMEMLSFVVDPKGDIYKCLGIDDLIIGNIETPGFNHLQPKSVALNTWRDCLECAYLPLCFGGCRYKSHLEYGDFTRTYCELDILEHMTKQYMRSRYQQSIGETVT